MKTLLAIIIAIVISVGGFQISDHKKDDDFINGIPYTVLDESEGVVEWYPDLPEIRSDELEIAGIITPIHTKEDAYRVAMDIIDTYHKEGYFPEHGLFHITYSPVNNNWLFEYSLDRPEDDKMKFIGGGFSISIDGDKGEIIQAWMVV